MGDYHPPPSDRRCIATNRSGKRCGRWAIPGGEVCHYHGGKTPGTVAKAKERLAVEKARAIAETMGLPIDIDPHEALLAEVHRSAGVVAWIETQVRALDPDEITWGVIKTDDVRRTHQHPTPDGIVELVDTQANTVRGAGVNHWVRLWGEERDRHVRACKAAIDAGVSEALVRIEEQKGALVARLLVAVFEDPALELSETQQAAAREVGARHLRAIPGPAA